MHLPPPAGRPRIADRSALVVTNELVLQSDRRALVLVPAKGFGPF